MPLNISLSSDIAMLEQKSDPLTLIDIHHRKNMPSEIWSCLIQTSLLNVVGCFIFWIWKLMVHVLYYLCCEKGADQPV